MPRPYEKLPLDYYSSKDILRYIKELETEGLLSDCDKVLMISEILYKFLKREGL